MAHVMKVGVVSRKSANRFEWIMDDFFSPQYVERKSFWSPYFSCGSDEWSVGLQVWSVKRRKMNRDFVDAIVRNRKGTVASRKWIRLGIVGRGCVEEKTAAFETNEIGAYNVKKWVERKEMAKIAADPYKGLVIFCEIRDVEEEGLDAPWYESCGATDDWQIKDWPAYDLPTENRSANDWSANNWSANDLPTHDRSANDWSSNNDWSTYDLPTHDWSANNDWSTNNLPTEDRLTDDWSANNDWSTSDLPTVDRLTDDWSQHVGLSNQLPVERDGFDVKIKEIKNISSVKQVKNKKSLDKLTQDLKQLLVSEELCDVVLEVQGERFKAHKIILAARSPVFHSMFHHDMKEKETGKVDIIDCDPEIFPDFLSYLYSGSADTLESGGNVYGLYEIADKYCVQELKEECVERMMSVSVETFCDVLSLAVKYCEKELVETCTAFFAQKMPEIILTAKWQAFISENGIAANELFIKALLPKEDKNKP